MPLLPQHRDAVSVNQSPGRLLLRGAMGGCRLVLLLAAISDAVASLPPTCSLPLPLSLPFLAHFHSLPSTPLPWIAVDSRHHHRPYRRRHCWPSLSWSTVAVIIDRRCHHCCRPLTITIPVTASSLLHYFQNCCSLLSMQLFLRLLLFNSPSAWLLWQLLLLRRTTPQQLFLNSVS